MSSESLMSIQLYDINKTLKSSYKFSIDSVVPIEDITTQGDITSSSTILTKESIAGIIVAAIISIIVIIVIIKFYKKY
jgi:hypothetical protein